MMVTLFISLVFFVVGVTTYLIARGTLNRARDIESSVDKSIEILNKSDKKKHMKVEFTCSSSVPYYIARKRMASRIGYAIRRELNGDFFKKYQDGDNVTYVSSFYITPKHD